MKFETWGNVRSSTKLLPCLQVGCCREMSILLQIQSLFQLFCSRSVDVSFEQEKVVFFLGFLAMEAILSTSFGF